MVSIIRSSPLLECGISRLLLQHGIRIASQVRIRSIANEENTKRQNVSSSRVPMIGCSLALPHIYREKEKPFIHKNGKESVKNLIHDLRQQTRKPSLHLCNSALLWCKSEGQWVYALEILDQMKKYGTYPKEVAYSTTISNLEEHSQWRLALNLVEESRAYSVDWQQRSTYLSSLKACAQGSKYKLALELLDEKQNKFGEATAQSHAAALWACSNAGEAELTLEQFQRMQERGVHPCANPYGAVIAVCEKTSRWSTGIAMLDEMRTKGLVPNVSSYLASLNLALMAGEWDRAFSLINETRERGLHSTKDKRFDYEVPSYQESHAAEQSLHALELIQTKPSLSAFSAAISAAEKSQQWGHVLELFDDMHRIGIEPNEPIFNAAIHAAAMTKKSCLALNLLETNLTTHGTIPDDSVLDQIIWTCVSDGNWVEAQRLKKLRNSTTKTST